MSSDDPDLWPDEVTLAAGDEHLLVEPALLSTTDDDWQRARPYQEDGHLENDDYRSKHPDA